MCCIVFHCSPREIEDNVCHLLLLMIYGKAAMVVWCDLLAALTNIKYAEPSCAQKRGLIASQSNSRIK